MASRAVQKLKKLLDKERNALLKGDLAALETLLPEKERLALSFHDANAAELKALSFKLAQNARLFEAARKGVADIVQSVQEHKAARESLSTYDQTGSPTQIGSVTVVTERRY